MWNNDQWTATGTGTSLMWQTRDTPWVGTMYFCLSAENDAGISTSTAQISKAMTALTGTTALTAAYHNSHKIKFTWTAIQGTYQYHIIGSRTSGFNASNCEIDCVYDYNVTSTFLDFFGHAGETWYWRTYLDFGAGTSTALSSQITCAMTPITGPTISTVAIDTTVGLDAIKITMPVTSTWDLSEQQMVAISTTADMNNIFDRKKVVPGTTITYFKNLIPGTTYYFAATYVHTSSDGWSSVESSYGAVKSYLLPQLTAPTSPSAVQAFPNGVKVTWVAPTLTGAYGWYYNIFVATSAADITAGNYVAVHQTAYSTVTTTCQFFVPGLDSSTTYYFAISCSRYFESAIAGVFQWWGDFFAGERWYVPVYGTDIKSTTVSMTTLPATIAAPPVSLTATADASISTRTTLSWSAVTGATAYMVVKVAQWDYSDTHCGFTPNDVSKIGIGAYGTTYSAANVGNVLTTNFSSCSPGIVNYFVVHAITAAGTTNPSMVAQATPLAWNSPPTPTATFSTKRYCDMNIAWSAYSGTGSPLSYTLYLAKPSDEQPHAFYYTDPQSGDTSWTRPAIVQSGTSKTLNRLEQNTTYNVYIGVRTDRGAIPQLSSACTFTTEAPAAVTGATLTHQTAISGKPYRLSWSAYTGAIRYTVAISESPTIDWANCYTNDIDPSIRYFDFYGLVSGKTYYFEVKATIRETFTSECRYVDPEEPQWIDSWGDFANVYKEYISYPCSTQSVSIPNTVSVPAFAPYPHKLSSYPYTGCRLTFDGCTKVTDYKVYMSESPTFEEGIPEYRVSTGVTRISTNGPYTAKDVYNLISGRTYYFRYAAIDVLGLESMLSPTTAYIVPTAPAITGIIIAESTSDRYTKADISFDTYVCKNNYTGYNVYYSTTPDVGIGVAGTTVVTPTFTVNGSRTSIEVTGLIENTTYYFKVSAYGDANGYFETSVGTTAHSFYVPRLVAPTRFSIVATTPNIYGGVKITIDNYSINSVATTSYNVYYSRTSDVGSGVAGTSIAVPTSVVVGATQTTMEVLGLAQGVQYYITVSAIWGASNWESLETSSISYLMPQTALVTGLEVTTLSDSDMFSGMALSVDNYIFDSIIPNGYYVYYSSSSNVGVGISGTTKVLATSISRGSSKTTMRVTGLTSGNSYYFLVSAYDSVTGMESRTNTTAVTATVPIASAPTNVTVDLLSSSPTTTAVVSIDNYALLTGTVSYNAYYSTDEIIATYADITAIRNHTQAYDGSTLIRENLILGTSPSVGASRTTFQVTGLKPDTKYYFRITLSNGSTDTLPTTGVVQIVTNPTATVTMPSSMPQIFTDYNTPQHYNNIFWRSWYAIDVDADRSFYEGRELFLNIYKNALAYRYEAIVTSRLGVPVAYREIPTESNYPTPQFYRYLWLYHVYALARDGQLDLNSITFAQFKKWCRANWTDNDQIGRVSDTWIASVWMTIHWQTPTFVMDSVYYYYNSGILMDGIVDSTLMSRFRHFCNYWTDCQECADSYGVMGTTYNLGGLGSWISMQRLWDNQVFEFKPRDYWFTYDVDNAGQIGYFVAYDQNYYTAYNIESTILAAHGNDNSYLQGMYNAKTFIHENGHALSGYKEQYDSFYDQSIVDNRTYAEGDPAWAACFDWADTTKVCNKRAHGPKNTSTNKEYPVTPYGCFSIGEAFAEAHAYFVCNPVFMQAKYPLQYAYINNLVNVKHVTDICRGYID